MKRPLWLVLVPLVLAAGAAGYYRHRHALSETVVQAAAAGDGAALLDAVERGADPNARDDDNVPVLCKLVTRGDLIGVHALIRQGARVDVRDLNGYTPLCEAVRQHNPELVGLLLEARANPNLGDRHGLTPLARAAESGQLLAVKDLLNAGAAPDQADRRGYTPLMAASAGGYHRVVQLLLNGGASPTAADNAGATALFYAAAPPRTAGSSRPATAAPDRTGTRGTNRRAPADRTETLRALLHAGAAVNTTDRSGRTPLLAAMEARTVNVIPALLAHGAAVNVRDAQGRSPLSLAVGLPSPLVQALRARGGKPTPDEDLLLSACTGDLPRASAALARGASAQAVDHDGHSVLNWSLRSRSVPLTRLLLQKGADARRPDPAADLPLIVALQPPLRRQASVNGPHSADEADAAIVKLLLASGADANALPPRPVQGWPKPPPLILAAGAGNALVVKALLAGGASPNQADASGTTALMHAVMPRRLAVARVLVDAGANLDAQDAMGRTALHVAASTGTGEGVRLLLRHGADVLATDAQGRNALQVAQESELSRQRFHMPPDPTRRDILNLLRKAGLKE